MKKIFIFILSLVLIVSLSACANETTEEVNLTTQETNEERDIVEEEIVDVEVEESTEDDDMAEVTVEDTGEEVVEDDPQDNLGEIANSFEWIGEYELDANTYTLEFGPKISDDMTVAIYKLEDNVDDVEVFTNEMIENTTPEVLELENEVVINENKLLNLKMADMYSTFGLIINEPGRYIIGTEYVPEELDMVLVSIDGEEISPVNEY